MIGDKLRTLLAQRNMRQSELARVTGISKTTINSIIMRNNKSVDFSAMEKIADALGVPIEYFMENNAKSNPTSVGVMADTQPRRSPVARVRRYDDHAVQSAGVILAPPEYQAKKYREEMQLKRLEKASGHITEEELELIKLFRSTDAKGQEMIKNIAQMVNERNVEKEEK